MTQTVNEAAAELRVHPETIRRLIRRGVLDAFKVGGVWRVDVSSLRPLEQREPRLREPSGGLARRAREMNRGG